MFLIIVACNVCTSEPLQFPHARVQWMLCFECCASYKCSWFDIPTGSYTWWHITSFQVLEVALSVMEQSPHYTSASPNLSGEVHLHSPSILGPANTHADWGTLLPLMSVVESVVGYERNSKPSCPSTADTEGCSWCWLTSHYKSLPVLFPLLLPHPYGSWICIKNFSCLLECLIRFELLEGRSSLSNPMKARCCVASKNDM